jgi:hypothetical protein
MLVITSPVKCRFPLGALENSTIRSLDGLEKLPILTSQPERKPASTKITALSIVGYAILKVTAEL